MKTQNFEYRLGDLTFRGYLAYDEARPGKRPGILVVHEAWGVGEHVRERAERLAGLGYVALAADMFGEGRQASSTQEGLGWTAALRNDVPTLRARIRAAFDALSSLPQVDPNRIASIGYCFGGTASLELARSGAPVVGVVGFHSNLSTQQPAEAGKVSAKILACIGTEDPFVPPAQVQTFVEEMTRAGADFQLILYGGAMHSFTNPKAAERGLNGLAYHKPTDERSWSAMQTFFHELFQA